MNKQQAMYINKKCYEQLARWAICTRKEISGYCFGSGYTITKVVRLRNLSHKPRVSAIANLNEERHVLKKMRHQKLICGFHSHPISPEWPSRGDHEIGCLPKDAIEIIICSKQGAATLRAWKICKSFSHTKKYGEIKLIIRK